jgi:hypothetical protein
VVNLIHMGAMESKIIEATNGPRNWGKFLIGRMDLEWARASAVHGAPKP